MPWTDNVRRRIATEEQIRRSAKRSYGDPGPHPPRLKTLARFIRATWPALRVEVRAVTESTDRKVGRLRIPGKGRRGNELEVYRHAPETLAGWERIYSHNAAETYRSNDEVCRWIVEALEGKISEVGKPTRGV